MYETRCFLANSLIYKYFEDAPPLQRALSKLHYDPGPTDGVLGPKTRTAIRSFQAASGLPTDGAMSSELYLEVLSAITRAEQR